MKIKWEQKREGNRVCLLSENFTPGYMSLSCTRRFLQATHTLNVLVFLFSFFPKVYANGEFVQVVNTIYIIINYEWQKDNSCPGYQMKMSKKMNGKKKRNNFIFFILIRFCFTFHIIFKFIFKNVRWGYIRIQLIYIPTYLYLCIYMYSFLSRNVLSVWENCRFNYYSKVTMSFRSLQDTLARLLPHCPTSLLVHF